MVKSGTFITSSILALCGGLILPSLASAQTASAAPQDAGDDTGEIVVTAQKRSENLQKVPVAVAVIGASAIESGGANTILDLKTFAPGVEVQSNNGYAAPIIRGVGTKATGPGIEAPIAIYVDGVYYASPTATLFNFNNIDQIEILKGPQGTLFGRNSTGGVIQITTKDPKHEFGGSAKISYGNYETARGDIYITGEIAPGVAADFAVQGAAMGKGYGRNLANGQDVLRINHDFSVRSKWLANLGDSTEARLILDYSDTKNSMFAQRVPAGESLPAPYKAGSYGGSPWDTSVDVQPLTTIKAGGVSLRIDHDFDTVQLASITAYRRSKFTNLFDFDITPVVGRSVYVPITERQFSQELQLQSRGSGPFEWTIGAYYFNAGAKYTPIEFRYAGVAILPGNVVRVSTFSDQKTDSISGFGQASYAVTDRLKLTAGLRYTSEGRELPGRAFTTSGTGVVTVTVPQRTLSRRFKKLTWRFSADYQFSDDTLGYVSFNRGFRSGGFNPSGLTLPPFKPEVLDAYEAGLKITALDRRLRINSAIFYYDYQDVQVQRVVDGANGVFNGAKAELYGFDTDISFRVTPDFTLTAGYQYTHGEYKSFPGSLIATPAATGGYAISVGDVSGRATVLTPKSSLSVSGNYAIPVGEGEINLNGSVYYNSGYFHEPDNLLREPSYVLLNASINWKVGNGLTVGAFGNNLTNEAVSNFQGILATGGGFGLRRQSLAPPRTYGLRLGVEF